MPQGTSRFYKIDIAQLPDDLDISLSAISSRGTAPKMYVSTSDENRYPQNTDTAKYVSTSYSGNVIFIASRDLSVASSIYVGLVCASSTCDTDVTFEYSKEIVTYADEGKIFEGSNSLLGASSAIIRLVVPNKPKTERIVMHIDAIPNNDEEVTTELSVFINQGNDIPFTSHTESIPRASWFEGRTIVIYKDDPIFCTGCNYTLSLKFNPYSSISFDPEIYDDETYLEGYAILDGVKKDHFNSYIFDIAESRMNEDLLIDIKPQEGKPRIYISCDKKPDNYTGYYWIYDVNEPREIILTTKEHSKCTTSTTYLLVTSKEPSVYSIRMTTKDTNRLFVGKDSPVVGDIFPNETITYEIFLPLFIAEKLIVTLESRLPIGVDIINCRFPTDCPNLLPGGIQFRHQINVETNATYEPAEFKYKREDLPNGKKLTLDPHSEGCYPIIIQDPKFMKDPLPVCAYMITLNSSNYLPVEYTLKASPEGHDFLYVGISKFSSVAKDETEYYSLNVPQTDVKQVRIQLTKFSGDFDVFVSKTEPYPKEQTDETEFSHEGLIIFKDKPDLSGSYYIGVYGLETSSFSISATVWGSDNKTEDYAQTLDLGIPQKGVLLPKHEHPEKYYKFTLNLDDDWNGTVSIVANTLRGSVLLIVTNDGSIPLPDSKDDDGVWDSGNDEQIEISSADEDFDPKGTYYVGVSVNWDTTQPQIEDVTYTITYFLHEVVGNGTETTVLKANAEHLFLSPLTPFYRTIKKGEADFYKAFILPKDQSITVFKQADAGDVDLFISLSLDNEYPDQYVYDYSTKVTHSDHIELTQEDLNKTCEAQETRLCTFFIGVFPKSGANQVSYSLTMKRDYGQNSTASRATPLEDGRQVQLNVPEGGQPALFYFYTVPHNASVLTVSCPGEQYVYIYAKYNKVKIGSSAKPELQVPNETSYDLTSNTNQTSAIGLAHITVPASDLLDSSIISVAVYFKTASRTGANVSTSTVYTVLVSSHIAYIYTGKPYYGAVEEGKYMYFSIDIAKPSCTLMISLTALDDGDPDIVINNFDSPPTMKSHVFASISYQKAEILEINNLDIYPKTSMAGTWVIGVYGNTRSTFTLTVVDEDQKMVQLRTDTPFEMYLRENSNMYFKYYHGANNVVRIRMNQLSGNSVAYVNTIAGQADLVQNLPNKTNHKWTIDSSNDYVLTVKQDDVTGCVKCMYLINVESTSSSKMSIVVSEAEKYVKVQSGIPNVAKLEPYEARTYLFTSATAEEITLSVVLKGVSLAIYASHNPEVSYKSSIWQANITSANPNQIISLVRSEEENKVEHLHVWNGIEYVESQRDSYYFQFDNMNPTPVTYIFTVTSEDTDPVLKPGVKHTMNLEFEGATSLIYYSSEEDEVIKLDLEFTVERNSSLGYNPDFERALSKGIPVTANFWGEGVNTGLGKEFPVVKDHIMRDNAKSKDSTLTYHFREGLTLESKKGRYSFDLENPFSTNITVSAMVYSSEFGTLSLEQSSQHTSSLMGQMSETYEFYLVDKGAWYLWGYACEGNFSLGINTDPTALEKGTKVKYGNGYLYRTMSNGGTTQYAKFTRTDSQEGRAEYILNAKLFVGEEHYNYDVKTPPVSPKNSFEYSPMGSKVSIKFDTIHVEEYDSKDTIMYHVKLCPYSKRDPKGEENLCRIAEDCRQFQQQVDIDDKVGTLQASFEKLTPQKYYIHVTADIQHNDQFIKFVGYPVTTIEVYKPVAEHVSDNMHIILIVLGAIVLIGVFCCLCYGRIKRFGEEKGFELPTLGQKRGYDFMGDDH